MNATMTDQATPAKVRLTDGLGPLVEPVTLADVLDALNVFNRPKPSEDDGPWEAEHFIRVDYLPAFINSIAAAWFSPAPLYAHPPQRKPLTDAESERLYKNIKPSQQQDARSCAAFKRLVRVVESAHGIGEAP